MGSKKVHCCSYHYLFFRESLLASGNIAACRGFVCSGISKANRGTGRRRGGLTLCYPDLSLDGGSAKPFLKRLVEVP